LESRRPLSRTLAAQEKLKAGPTSVTVPGMPPPSRRSRALSADRRRRARAARLRRVVGATVLGTGLLVTLLVTAFGSGNPGALQATGPLTQLPAGPPLGKVIATQGPEGTLRLYLPISEARRTAMAYHASGDGALALDPVGRQANEGVFTRAAHRVFGGGSSGLAYYMIGGGSGPSTSALDVGAAAGTDVYSPVNGTVVGLSPFVLDGKKYGSRIEIQPTESPSVVVALSQLNADPALRVGSSLTFSRTKVGTVVDLSGVQRQALARYTQDAGNHVTIQAFPAATLTLR
jgi:hypothetical protein